MKEYIIGVDLHSTDSRFAVLDRNERIIAEETFQTEDRSGMVRFVSRFRGPESTSRLVVEATTGWYWFVDFLRPHVDGIKIADPFWAKQCLRGRSAKTDRLDALGLAQLEIRGRIVEGYLMSPEMREVRDALRTRTRLVQQATRLKLRIGAILRNAGLRCPFRDRYGKSGRAWLQRQSLSEGWRLQIREQVRLIDEHEKSIREMEGFALRSRTVREHPYVALLQSIPGVGQIWAMTIALEIGTLDRFGGPEDLVSYCGLAPFVHQSQKTRFHYGVKAHRNTWLKAALTMVALHAKKSPNLQDEYRRARRRHTKKVANVTVARKLTRILFWMLTRKEEFRGSEPKAARPA